MRGPWMKILFAVSTALIVLLAACSNIIEEENTMISKGQIPPIDTCQPAQIETATFALG